MHWFDLLQLTIAYVLALPIGYERESDERSAGLRTYPLFALATCAFMLIGYDAYPGDTQSRIFQGLLSGLGVLCAGAIIQARERVHGTSTAASMLGTAALGTAVAYRRFDIAVYLAVVIFVTLRFLRPWKERIDKQGELPLSGTADRAGDGLDLPNH